MNPANQDGKVDIFRLVGLAVAASQIFETTFVLTARFAFKQPNLQVFEDIKQTAFKQPVKALLRELGLTGSIPETLSKQIESLVEKRHRIVHRAFLETGWPAKLNSNQEAQLEKLCVTVVTESLALSGTLSKSLLAWMKRFPETEEVSNDYSERFANLSERLHAQNIQAEEWFTNLST